MQVTCNRALTRSFISWRSRETTYCTHSQKSKYILWTCQTIPESCSAVNWEDFYFWFYNFDLLTWKFKLILISKLSLQNTFSCPWDKPSEIFSCSKPFFGCPGKGTGPIWSPGSLKKRDAVDQFWITSYRWFKWLQIHFIHSLSHFVVKYSKILVKESEKSYLQQHTVARRCKNALAYRNI